MPRRTRPARPWAVRLLRRVRGAVDHGDVSEKSVLDILERADKAAQLPRLGGMARPDGVAIVTDTSWALSGVDGSVRTRDLPRRRALERIPLVRGLARLALALVPLLAR